MSRQKKTDLPPPRLSGCHASFKSKAVDTSGRRRAGAGFGAFYTANTNLRCKCTLLHKPECRKHQKSCLHCACRNQGPAVYLASPALATLKGRGQTPQPACTFGLGQVPLPTQAPTTATQQPQLLLQLKLHPDLPQLESLSWQQPTRQKHCKSYIPNRRVEIHHGHSSSHLVSTTLTLSFPTAFSRRAALSCRLS
jgi:hypothetical protein